MAHGEQTPGMKEALLSSSLQSPPPQSCQAAESGRLQLRLVDEGPPALWPGCVPRIPRPGGWHGWPQPGMTLRESREGRGQERVPKYGCHEAALAVGPGVPSLPQAPRTAPPGSLAPLPAAPSCCRVPHVLGHLPGTPRATCCTRSLQKSKHSFQGEASSQPASQAKPAGPQLSQASAAVTGRTEMRPPLLLSRALGLSAGQVSPPRQQGDVPLPLQPPQCRYGS